MATDSVMPLHPEVGAVDPAPRGVREVLDCGSPLPLSEDRFGAHLGTAPEVGRRCGAADTSAATSIARSRPVSRPRYWPSAFHGRAAARPYQTGGSVKKRPQVRPRSEGHCAKATIPIGSFFSAFRTCLRPGPKRQRTAAVHDASRGPVRREPGRAWFHPRPDQFTIMPLHPEVGAVDPAPRGVREVLDCGSPLPLSEDRFGHERAQAAQRLRSRWFCLLRPFRACSCPSPKRQRTAAVHDAGATSSGPPLEVILTP